MRAGETVRAGATFRIPIVRCWSGDPHVLHLFVGQSPLDDNWEPGGGRDWRGAAGIWSIERTFPKSGIAFALLEKLL